MALHQHAYLRGDFAERTFRPRSFSRGVNFLCAWTLLAETSVLGNAFLRPPVDVSPSVQLEPHGTAMISHPSALAVRCALLLGGLLPIDMCIGNAARRSLSMVNNSRRSTETSPGSSGSFCGWSSHNKVHFSFVHAFACEALSTQRDWIGFTEGAVSLQRPAALCPFCHSSNTLRLSRRRAHVLHALHRALAIVAVFLTCSSCIFLQSRCQHPQGRQPLATCLTNVNLGPGTRMYVSKRLLCATNCCSKSYGTRASVTAVLTWSSEVCAAPQTRGRSQRRASSSQLLFHGCAQWRSGWSTYHRHKTSTVGE